MFLQGMPGSVPNLDLSVGHGSSAPSAPKILGSLLQLLCYHMQEYRTEKREVCDAHIGIRVMQETLDLDAKVPVHMESLKVT